MMLLKIIARIEMYSLFGGKFSSYLKQKTGIHFVNPGQMAKNHLAAIIRLERQDQRILQGKPLAVVVDGTPYHGEALATVVRAIDVKPDKVTVLTVLIVVVGT